MIANGQRKVRATGEHPRVLFEANLQGLRALPQILPAGGIYKCERLGRDYYVRVDSNDYSVHPCVIGHFVETRVSLDRVEAFWDSRLVASYERVFTKAGVITDPAHVLAAKEQ